MSKTSIIVIAGAIILAILFFKDRDGLKKQAIDPNVSIEDNKHSEIIVPQKEPEVIAETKRIISTLKLQTRNDIHYEVGDPIPFTGTAQSHHSNGNPLITP